MRSGCIEGAFGLDPKMRALDERAFGLDHKMRALDERAFWGCLLAQLLPFGVAWLGLAVHGGRACSTGLSDRTIGDFGLSDRKKCD